MLALGLLASCSAINPPAGGTNESNERSEDVPSGPENPFAAADPQRVLYVRSGASGDASGVDWTNALPELPSTLERGYTYYLADGAYHVGGYTFDTPEENDAWVYLVKARPGGAGDAVDWDPSYGDGTTTLGPMRVAAPRLYMDGGADRGIVVRGGYQGTALTLAAEQAYITGIDVDANFVTDSTGYHTGGSCTGLHISGDDVAVIDSVIHDAADDGVTATSVSGLYFAGNEVVDLRNCGTDGGCGPCFNGHSDGLELYGVRDAAFVGNFIRLDEATGCVFYQNWESAPDAFNRNVVFANNVFYKNGGFIAYFQNFDGLKLYNNTMWGIRQGSFGGVSIGRNAANLEMKNNIVLSVNFEYQNSAFDPAVHRGDHNVLGADLGSPNYELDATDLVASDPGFSGVNGVSGPYISDAEPQDFNPLPQSLPWTPALRSLSGRSTSIRPSARSAEDGMSGLSSNSDAQETGIGGGLRGRTLGAAYASALRTQR